MVILDATVVLTALPQIGTSLRASTSDLQWVVDGYTVVFACLLMSGGSLGDRIGARKIFLIGLALFTIASVLCGVASTLIVLNAARIVQGIGAALILPTSLALINSSYHDRAKRARAIGVWGTFSGIAAGLGPVLGGLLTTWVGWQAIFYINVPIGIAAIILTLRYVEASAKKERTQLDPAGQVLAVIAVAALAYGLIEAGPQGWTSPSVVVAFVVFLASGTGFLIVEKRHADPMLPLRFFRSREFSGSILIGAIINLGFYGELFMLSLYFQHVCNLSPLLTGLALLPQVAVIALCSLLSGRHIAKVGPRVPMVVGLTAGTVGLLAMMLLTPMTPYWMIVFPLLAIGCGISYTMPAATTATIEAAPVHQAGVASGTLNASRQIGSTLGVAIFGTLITATGDFMDAYHLSVLIGGLLFAVGGLIALLVIPSNKPKLTERRPVMNAVSVSGAFRAE